MPLRETILSTKEKQCNADQESTEQSLTIQDVCDDSVTVTLVYGVEALVIDIVPRRNSRPECGRRCAGLTVGSG